MHNNTEVVVARRVGNIKRSNSSIAGKADSAL